jgi:predicted DNA-binding transcriptional regulator AlpA
MIKNDIKVKDLAEHSRLFGVVQTFMKDAGGSCYIRTKELSLITGLKVNTINQYRNDGKIPYYKLNGRLCYYKLDEIIDWMTENMTPCNSNA